MLVELKQNSAIENCFSYFSYFNHKLYENPSDIHDEEDYIIKSGADFHPSEDSSTNTSNDSIDMIDNEEKLIPLNLLDLSPNKTSFETKEKDFLNPKKLFDSINEKVKSEQKEKSEDENKQIHPDLSKYKLPKDLFCPTKNKKCEKCEKEEKEVKEEKNIFKNSSSSPIIETKLNICNQPFIPKYNLYPFIIYNNACYSNNIRNKFGQLPATLYNIQRKNIVEKKKKKKKQEFIEREGDWSCYRCKNINFSFRDKCNKCQLSKEESEKKFTEVGEALLRLADTSIYDKIRNDNSN